MKRIILIIIFVFVSGGIIFACITSQKDIDVVIERDIDEVTNFFITERELLEETKEQLRNADYDIKYIKEDGHIVIKDDSIVWEPQISPNIKEIMNRGKNYNIRSIYYDPETIYGKMFWVEAYFSQTAVMIEIVYSLDDLSSSPNSSMYERLDGNWYLFVAGMT